MVDVRVVAALLSLLVIAGTRSAQAQDSVNPDQLYADRTHLPSAQQAATIWEARLKANPRDFESAWKLARALYWIGDHVPEKEQRAQYERGMSAANEAVRLAPMQPEGHFWLAANMGSVAQTAGLRAGLRYRAQIKRELEIVLMIDPAYQKGSADRGLGRWYFKVPGLFGGNREKSVEHLQRSLTYDPENTASRYFLAETLVDMGRRDEARRELQRVLDAPFEVDWAPEDRDFKARAAALLTTLRAK